MVVIEAAHVDVDFAVCGDGVHRRAALDGADRERGLRGFRDLDVRNLGAGDAHCVNGARDLAEGGV